VQECATDSSQQTLFSEGVSSFENPIFCPQFAYYVSYDTNNADAFYNGTGAGSTNTSYYIQPIAPSCPSLHYDMTVSVTQY
jgi:hypothetical protein